MQHEKIVLDKTHKFLIEVETTKINPRDFIEQMVEECYGEDVYFEVKSVKVV